MWDVDSLSQIEPRPHMCMRRWSFCVVVVVLGLVAACCSSFTCQWELLLFAVLEFLIAVAALAGGMGSGRAQRFVALSSGMQAQSACDTGTWVALRPPIESSGIWDQSSSLWLWG